MTQHNSPGISPSIATEPIPETSMDANCEAIRNILKRILRHVSSPHIPQQQDLSVNNWGLSLPCRGRLPDCAAGINPSLCMEISGVRPETDDMIKNWFDTRTVKAK